MPVIGRASLRNLPAGSKAGRRAETCSAWQPTCLGRPPAQAGPMAAQLPDRAQAAEQM